MQKVSTPNTAAAKSMLSSELKQNDSTPRRAECVAFFSSREQRKRGAGVDAVADTRCLSRSLRKGMFVVDRRRLPVTWPQEAWEDQKAMSPVICNVSAMLWPGIGQCCGFQNFHWDWKEVIGNHQQSLPIPAKMSEIKTIKPITAITANHGPRPAPPITAHHAQSRPNHCQNLGNR